MDRYKRLIMPFRMLILAQPDLSLVNVIKMVLCKHLLLSDHFVFLNDSLETVYLLLQLLPALDQRHEYHRYDVLTDLMAFLYLEYLLQAQIVLLCFEIVTINPMADTSEIPEVEQSIISPRAQFFSFEKENNSV
jgi:hypothetical protein